MKPCHRSVLTAALVAALSASSLFVTAAPANAAATIVYDLVDNPGFVSPESKCEADVAIVGTRGSDQPLLDKDADPEGHNEGKPTQTGARPQDQVVGFGNEVATAAYEITRRLPAETNVRLIPIDYPAVHANNGVMEEVEVDLPVIDNFEVLVPGLTGTYKTSVLKGVEITVNTVRTLSKACPGTKVVLIGFSQGAQVAHWALEELKKEGLLGNIAAVQLIADPTRNGKDTVAHNYTGKGALASDYPWQDPYRDEPGAIQPLTQLGGQGALIEGSWLTKYPYVPLPEELRGKVVNVCHSMDLVCDNSLRDYYSAHGEVYTNSFRPGKDLIANTDIYTAPGQWMTERLNIARRSGGGSGGLDNGSKCTDVTVVGARGEDWVEAPDRKKPEAEITGFGPVVSAAAKALDDKLPQATSVSFASVYPHLEAPGPGSLAPKRDISEPETVYGPQVVEGARAARDLMAQKVDECPATKLVLAGFSRGAQVLHESVSTVSPTVLSRIAAVWLMGDTARDPSSFRGHVAGAGESLPEFDDEGQEIGGANARNALAFPADLTDRLHSVCMLADKSCRHPVRANSVPEQRLTQQGIYLESETVTRGAEWAAPRVESLQLPAGAKEAAVRRGVHDAVAGSLENARTYGTGVRLLRP